MTHATALLRRVTLAWLMLGVAGSGAASFAVPVPVERDAEVETSAELYLCRESVRQHRRPRHTDRAFAASGPVESRCGEDCAAEAPIHRGLRSFPSLRASEIRIQV